MDILDSVIKDVENNIHLNLSIQRCKNSMVIMTASMLPTSRKSQRKGGKLADLSAFLIPFFQKYFLIYQIKEGLTDMNGNGWSVIVIDLGCKKFAASMSYSDNYLHAIMRSSGGWLRRIVLFK